MPTMTLCMARDGRTPAIALAAVRMGQEWGQGQEPEPEQGLVVSTAQAEAPQRMVVLATPPATQATRVVEGSLPRAVDVAAGESEK